MTWFSGRTSAGCGYHRGVMLPVPRHRLMLLALATLLAPCLSARGTDIVFGDSGGFSLDTRFVDPHTAESAVFDFSVTPVARVQADSASFSLTVAAEPLVLNVTSPTPDGHYTVGAEILVTVQFSEPVTVDTTGGTPTLLLETGPTERDAVYAGMDPNDPNNAPLLFLYTVQAGDVSPDLDYVSTTALSLNGATIKCTATPLDADLALPTPGASGSLSANKAISILRGFFDDFLYADPNDPLLTCFGWTVRSGGGGPRPDVCSQAQQLWDPNLVAFTNGLVTLSAQTDGNSNCESTHQSEVGTSASFFEGTYSARVRFTDAPRHAPTPEPSVQAFFTYNSRLECDPEFAEIDYEYLPNDNWDQGCSDPVLYMNSWEMWGDPETAEPNCPTIMTSVYQCGSFATWHTYTLQVVGDTIRFFVDDADMGTHVGDTYPEAPMQIRLQHWFTDGLAPGVPAVFTMAVDWVYHAKDVALTPAQVSGNVESLRAVNLARWDAMGDKPDCNGNGIPDACDVVSGTSPDSNLNSVPDECEAVRGDLDGDGSVDFGDINPFVLLLSNPTLWQQTYPDCPMINGDINPFVALLANP